MLTRDVQYIRFCVVLRLISRLQRSEVKCGSRAGRTLLGPCSAAAGSGGWQEQAMAGAVGTPLPARGSAQCSTSGRTAHVSSSLSGIHCLLESRTCVPWAPAENRVRCQNADLLRRPADAALYIAVPVRSCCQ